MARLTPAWLLGSLFLLCTFSVGANPIVRAPFTADPSAHVFGDRLYIYTSHDEADSVYFDMFDWRLFSTADLKTWTDHGAIFDLKGFTWAKQYAWAPGALEADGKYFLYLPVDRAKIGVAVADSPTGPFRDAKGSPLIDRATQPEVGPEPIDPALYVDGSEKVFMYFGCRQLKVVELSDDKLSLKGPVLDVQILSPDGKPTPIAPPDVQPELPMSYGEAPFVFRRNGLLYLVYSNGWAPESNLVYATGQSPQGPFTYQGEVMKRVNSVTHHASVVEFKGRWFIVYHTSDVSGGNMFRRNVYIDEMTFDETGRIVKVTQTASGPRPIDAAPSR